MQVDKPEPVADAQLELFAYPLRDTVSAYTVGGMNREADQPVRLTAAVKRRVDKDWRRLQLDLEHPLTYSEMIDKAWDQVVYAHLLAAFRKTEGGKR